jgi:hypothetical protein
MKPSSRHVLYAVVEVCIFSAGAGAQVRDVQLCGACRGVDGQMMGVTEIMDAQDQSVGLQLALTARSVR